MPCTNALPKTRAKSCPNRRARNESTGSSCASSSSSLTSGGRLALPKGSAKTAGNKIHDKGLDADQGENNDHKSGGKGNKPCPSLSSGTYKNRTLAAGDDFGVVMSCGLRSRRCIYVCAQVSIIRI